MSIESLKASLAAAPPTLLPPTTLKIEPIDISKWTEFGTFFDQPDIKSIVYQTGAPLNMVLDCSFFSVVSASRETAIQTLRKDLLFIKNLFPRILVVGFLSKPSTLEIVTPPKPNDIADTVYTDDLSGPKPGKRKWAAFCFLFAYEDGGMWAGKPGYKQLTPKDWRKLGLPSAMHEGEIGHEVPASDQLLMSVGESDWDHQTWDDPLFTRGTGAMTPDEVEIDVSDLEPVMASKEIEYEPQPYHDQKLSTLSAQGETKAAKVIGALHPEIQAAADKHGIDLGGKPGRELEEMRKYFGAGSGLYMATVDFQTARVNSTKLTEEAQKRILNALKDDAKPKRKRKAKKAVKTKRLTRRRRSR